MSSTASGSSRTPRRTRITPVAAAPIPVCLPRPHHRSRRGRPSPTAQASRRSGPAGGCGAPACGAALPGRARRNRRPHEQTGLPGGPPRSATLWSSAYISRSQVPSWSEPPASTARRPSFARMSRSARSASSSSTRTTRCPLCCHQPCGGGEVVDRVDVVVDLQAQSLESMVAPVGQGHRVDRVGAGRGERHGPGGGVHRFRERRPHRFDLLERPLGGQVALETPGQVLHGVAQAFRPAPRRSAALDLRGAWRARASSW